MSTKEFKCVLISSFNIDSFTGYLNNDEEKPAVKSIATPYNQVIQSLTDGSLEHWKANPDFMVVWTRPESVIGSFNRLINYKNGPIDEVLKEVDEYASLLLKASSRVKIVFIPIWVSPSYNRGFGMLDMKNDIGITNTLMRMNLRLSEDLSNATNIYLLDTQKWVSITGKNAFNPKLWYMGKIAFNNQVFMEAVKDIKSALRGITGNSKKLIILDLDDILWGGIAGDVGWENIQLGGHDAIGESYVDFQKALKSLRNRGILLGIVSKNEEAVALEVINKHPEMVLKPDDFAGWRINWKDKAQGIVDLVSDLNLGLQSAVFVDDNPVEQARVREALPEVLVPEWPGDPMLYKSALLSLRCFDVPSINSEDLKRTEMYKDEEKRRAEKKKVGSLDKWLKSLNMKVKVEELNNNNLKRAVQLLNKTNQMNLAARRMTEAELLDWAGKENRKFWTFRVSDKFGDSGLTGIISLEVRDRAGQIVDFVLSCRVIGRRVEEAMIYTATKYTRSLALDEMYAKYIPTPKNKPCLEFWKRAGFAHDDKNGLFKWKTKKDYPAPASLEIENL